MNHDGTTNTTADDDSDQQQWIDELLRSSAAAEMEAAPAPVKFAANAAIGKLWRRQRRRQSLAVFAAAATLVAVWAWPTTEDAAPGSARGSNHTEVANSNRASTPRRSRGLQEINASPVGRGTFVANGDAIAVELESDSPDVTVVNILPTIGAERQWRRELALQSKSHEPSGG